MNIKDKLNKMNSVEKALAILKQFAEPPYEYSIKDISDLTGVNRTTVHRDITMLVNSGLLMSTINDKKYALGPITYKMGNVYLTNGDDKDNTLRILGKIGEESRESVGLARREGNTVLSIYSVESHQSLKMNDRPGTYYPMNKGTYGKCLMAYHDIPVTKEMLQKQEFERSCTDTLTDPDEILSEYENIRKNGYVLSIEETFPHVIGVGVPLRGQDGKVRNVVAVSFFKGPDWEEKINNIKEILFKYKPKLEQYMR